MALDTQLNTLASMPQLLADKLAGYVNKSASMRTNATLSPIGRRQQIEAMRVPLIAAVKDMRDQYNATDTAIRSSLSPTLDTNKDVSTQLLEETRLRNTWEKLEPLLGAGASLAYVGQTLADSGDREAFAAIRRFGPYWLMAKQQSMPEADYVRFYGDWSMTLSQYEDQLMTDDERSSKAIVATLDRNGGMMRGNFESVLVYLSREGTQVGLQGGNSLPRLAAWSVQPGQGGIIPLSDDQLAIFGKANAAAPFAGYPVGADLPALAEFGR
jgi:hypothetical protein